MKKHHWTGLALVACLTPSLTAAEPAVARHLWNFENEDARYADQIGTVHGSVSGATTITISPGHEVGGSAMKTVASITGANDFVALNGDAPGFFEPGTGAFSMSLWFRMPTATTNNRGIFDFSGNSQDGPQMLLTAANSLNFRVDGSGAYNLVAMIPSSTVEDDQWHFVVAVYDPALETGTLKVYLDGATATATASRGTTPATTVNSPSACWLGTFNYGGVTQSNGTDGDLDDLAYYSGALTEQQIGQLLAGTLKPGDLAPPPQPPVITLTSYQRDADSGTSTIAWLSETETEYTVWGSTNLKDWTEVTVSTVIGTGGEVQFEHTPPANTPIYFYKVRDD